MKTNEALYELIHSLTKNEKRYFKLYCSGLSGRDGSNYLSLFEALERQKKYDAEALKKSLKKPSLVKNLSSEKNYLFNLILESMLVYHKDDAEIRVRTMLNKVDLLFSKSLSKPGYKLLISAKKVAVAYEAHTLLLDALKIEAKFYTRNYDLEAMKSAVEEEHKLLQESLQVNRYNDILTRLLDCSVDTTYQRAPEQRRKLDAIMSEELVQDESKPMSFKAKYLYYTIWANYYHIIKEKSRTTAINRKIVELSESTPEYLVLNLSDYLIDINNLIIEGISLNSRETADFALERLGSFTDKYASYITPAIRENHRQRYLEACSRVGGWFGDFDKVIELLPQLKDVCEEKTLPPPRRETISFYSAYALFAKKRYKESLRWLHALIDIFDTGYGSYLFYMRGKFLRLMIHTELENYELIEEESIWLNQFLSKRNKLHRSEAELLAFFISLSKCTSSKERDRLFHQIFELVNALMADPYEYPFIHALMFIYKWIKSKVEKRNLEETAREIN